MPVEEKGWEEMVKNILRAEMMRRGVSYAGLAERLQEYGIEDNELNLRNKVSRGRFIVFSEWSPVNGSLVKRRDYSLAHLLVYQPMEGPSLFSDLGEEAFIPKTEAARQQVQLPNPRSPTAAELVIMRRKLPKVRVKPLTEPIEANHRDETDDKDDRTEQGTPTAAQLTWDADSFRRNANRARSVGTVGGLHGLPTLGMAHRQIEAESVVPKNRDVDVRRRVGAEGDGLRTASGEVGAEELNGNLRRRKAGGVNHGIPAQPPEAPVHPSKLAKGLTDKSGSVDLNQRGRDGRG